MGDRENTAPENQQRQSDPHAPLPPAPTTPATNPNQPHGNDFHDGTRSEPENSEHWFQNPDWWMVILTALTVFVAAVTLRVFYHQFQEMQRQSRILNTQAQQAAADSIESAKKVEEQLRIANRQARAIQRQMRTAEQAFGYQVRSDRPSLSLLNIYFRSPLTTGTDNEIEVEIGNTGNTAALKAELKAPVFISPYKEMTEFHLNTEGQNFPSFDIPARDTHRWHLPFYVDVLNAYDLDPFGPIARHIKIIYVAGFMTWTDNAGESLRQDLCAYYAPEAGTRFVQCPHGFKIIDDTTKEKQAH